MPKKVEQIEELILAPVTDGSAVPPPPRAWYDFYKTNGQDVVTLFEGPSMTRQEFAEDCDINVLMKRFENRDIGAIMRAVGEPTYVDWSTMPSDLMEAMQRMGDAENAFMTLPASVRKEFENDPVAFVDFASNRDNLDKLRDWGLAPPAVKAPPAASPPPAGGEPAAKPPATSTQ